MLIEYTTGCVCDYLGIDNIREVEMTDSQRKEYFNEIAKHLDKLDGMWFNSFLRWVAMEFGDYSCSEQPCTVCGDYIESYTLEI